MTIDDTFLLAAIIAETKCTPSDRPVRQALKLIMQNFSAVCALNEEKR